MLTKGQIILVLATLFVAGASVGMADRQSPNGHPRPVDSRHKTEAFPQTAGTSAATTNSKASRFVAAEDYILKLLLLMEVDKNRKVSKQEFMNFMSAAFDRLDTHHGGELNVNELAGPHMRPYLGK